MAENLSIGLIMNTVQRLNSLSCYLQNRESLCDLILIVNLAWFSVWHFVRVVASSFVRLVAIELILPVMMRWSESPHHSGRRRISAIKYLRWSEGNGMVIVLHQHAAP
jgi:hypothetical protein